MDLVCLPHKNKKNGGIDGAHFTAPGLRELIYATVVDLMLIDLSGTVLKKYV